MNLSSKTAHVQIFGGNQLVFHPVQLLTAELQNKTTRVKFKRTAQSKHISKQVNVTNVNSCYPWCLHSPSFLDVLLFSFTAAWRCHHCVSQWHRVIFSVKVWHGFIHGVTEHGPRTKLKTTPPGGCLEASASPFSNPASKRVGILFHHESLSFHLTVLCHFVLVSYIKSHQNALWGKTFAKRCSSWPGGRDYWAESR